MNKIKNTDNDFMKGGVNSGSGSLLGNLKELVTKSNTEFEHIVSNTDKIVLNIEAIACPFRKLEKYCHKSEAIVHSYGHIFKGASVIFCIMIVTLYVGAMYMIKKNVHVNSNVIRFY